MEHKEDEFPLMLIETDNTNDKFIDSLSNEGYECSTKNPFDDLDLVYLNNL